MSSLPDDQRPRAPPAAIPAVVPTFDDVDVPRELGVLSTVMVEVEIGLPLVEVEVEVEVAPPLVEVELVPPATVTGSVRVMRVT